MKSSYILSIATLISFSSAASLPTCNQQSQCLKSTITHLAPPDEWSPCQYKVCLEYTHGECQCRPNPNDLLGPNNFCSCSCEKCGCSCVETSTPGTFEVDTSSITCGAPSHVCCRQGGSKEITRAYDASVDPPLPICDHEIPECCKEGEDPCTDPEGFSSIDELCCYGAPCAGEGSEDFCCGDMDGGVTCAPIPDCCDPDTDGEFCVPQDDCNAPSGTCDYSDPTLMNLNHCGGNICCQTVNGSNDEYAVWGFKDGSQNSADCEDNTIDPYDGTTVIPYTTNYDLTDDGEANADFECGGAPFDTIDGESQTRVCGDNLMATDQNECRWRIKAPCDSCSGDFVCSDDCSPAAPAGMNDKLEGSAFVTMDGSGSALTLMEFVSIVIVCVVFGCIGCAFGFFVWYRYTNKSVNEEKISEVISQNSPSATVENSGTTKQSYPDTQTEIIA